jgi:hypothetical protein
MHCTVVTYFKPLLIGVNEFSFDSFYSILEHRASTKHLQRTLIKRDVRVLLRSVSIMSRFSPLLPSAMMGLPSKT